MPDNSTSMAEGDGPVPRAHALSRHDFHKCDLILVKVGTGVVTSDKGHLALGRVGHLVEQITALHERNKRIVLVTSGAVGAGRRKLNKQAIMMSSLRSQMGDLNNPTPHDWDPKACAAAGQSRIMSLYEQLFSMHDIRCAQVLVMDSDFSSPEKRKSFASTINTLLSIGIIPIINENDVMTNRETPLTDSDGHIFWDNDSLASIVSSVIGVQLQILLTDVDGLYFTPPESVKKGVAPRVMHFYRANTEVELGAKSRVGRGGMQAKIAASLDAISRGVGAVVIASGHKQNSILDVCGGATVGTLFSSMSFDDSVSPRQQAQLARDASRSLCSLSSEHRSAVLLAIADALAANSAAIHKENQRDLDAAVGSGMSKAMADRLVLTGPKLAALCAGIRQLASGPDPLSRVHRKTELAPGLILVQEAAPIGVLLIIFESRPDALPQIASLALQSGNGLLLKGGKEAAHTNRILHSTIVEAIERSSNGAVPRDVLQLVESREDIGELLQLDDCIDLVIPRGSSDLVNFIKGNTRIPVLGHADGVCHVYVDQYADLSKADHILIDSKTSYPAACNSAETVLVHEALIANGGVNTVLQTLGKAGVKLLGGPRAVRQLHLPAAPSLKTEYSDLAMSLEIVSDVDDAIAHVHKYGSGHTETIVTEDGDVAEQFLRQVDSACIFHNASTRFSDGFRFGLGAEVGISTGRIHARGPVGVEGLLTTRWKLRSSACHTVDMFSSGQLDYTHKALE
ncbi:unnamed protein product (mitochondrion) [Plasmodiophora brassicae]|uniref:Delta-1-pyrroline-5-carboxylate synthase n=1 Tax=Plasmodiophora brassicae TaxID=37360 RepID=A0A0G4IMH3_PLABS|nr:hypothetical protein PBRA_004968 [Plasmodiophora brassicae]SPQ99237.1 unnamed protein product [Plasmodiophora brassicae]